MDDGRNLVEAEPGTVRPVRGGSEGFQRGSTDYIVNPFSPTDFAGKVRADLRGWTVSRLVEPS